MFGIGVPELILILIIGLVVFGPGKLPEVGRAVGKARLTRVQANDLVNKILPKYQPLIDNRTLHTKGGDFRTVYDLETVQPKPEYLAIYNKVKAELRELGLPIK